MVIGRVNIECPDRDLKESQITHLVTELMIGFIFRRSCFQLPQPMRLLVLWFAVLVFVASSSAYCFRTEQASQRLVAAECVTIVNSDFADLRAPHTQGGAIYIHYGTGWSASVIAGCNFVNCSCDYFGGVVGMQCLTGLLQFCSATSCAAFENGGFLSMGNPCDSVNHSLSQISVWNCGASRAAGILFQSGLRVSGSSVNCTHCTAVNAGAGLQWDDAAAYTTRTSAIFFSVFTDNLGLNSVSSRGTSTVTLQTCAFIQNKVTSSVLSSRQAVAFVIGCLFNRNAGSPFALADSSPAFVVYDCSFDHEAWVAGSVFVDSAGNAWNAAQSIGRYAQTPVRFTDPGVSPVFGSVPPAQLRERPTTRPDEEPDSGGMSAWEIAAVVVGGVCLLVLITLVACICDPSPLCVGPDPRLVDMAQGSRHRGDNSQDAPPAGRIVTL
jgi:hypothetical protein